MKAIPSVRRGTPEAYEANEYGQMTINGATVYVHNSVKEAGQLVIDVDSGFMGSKLVLRGLEQENKGGCCG